MNEQQDSFTLSLLSISRGMTRLSRRCARHNITIQQVDTVFIIGEHGQLPVGVLGELLGIAASTVSRNLITLEKMGFVSRMLNPALDRREVFVRLTEKGRLSAKALGASINTQCGSILSVMPREDRTRLVQALEEVARILDPSTSTRHPYEKPRTPS